MKTRRNPVSYLAWILYAILALAFSYRVFSALAVRLGFYRVYGIAGSLVLLAVMFGVYALIRRLRSGRLERLLDSWDLTGAETFARSRKHQLLATGILAILLCVAGAVLRYLHFQTDSADAGIWFDLAKVTQVPLAGRVHAAEDWYLRLLHGSFFLFGNHLWAGVLLQALLQYFAVIACFFAVKRSAGKLAALCMTGFWMLSSYGISQVFTLGPGMLDFLLFSFTFLMLTRVMPVRGKNPLWAIFAGIFTGACLYADVTLCVLLVLSLGIFWARPSADGEGASYFVTRKEHPTPFQVRAIRFLLYLAAAVLAFAAFLALDTVLGGDPLSAVAAGMKALYTPGSAMFSGLLRISELSVESVILAVLLLLGIPAFVFRSDRDMGSLFAVSLTVLFVLLVLGIPTRAEDGTVLVFTLLTILAGLDKAIPVLSDARQKVVLAGEALQESEPDAERTILEATEPAPAGEPAESAEPDVLTEEADAQAETPAVDPEDSKQPKTKKEKKQKEKKQKEKKEKKPKKQPAGEETAPAPEEPLRKKVTATVDGVEKEVELLPNPLGLPKKKDVRKMMDFDYEVPEDDDFDI